MSTTLSLGLPETVHQAGLDDQVEVWEVSPRDGLQAEPTLVDAETKVELVHRLVQAGAKIIEVGSFVREDRVPQMASSAEVYEQVRDLGVRTPVLVPNLKGYEKARSVGCNEVAVFLSATESFSVQNLGAARDRVEAAAAAVVVQAKRDGVRVRGYLSMAFGDPWEGAVAPADVIDISVRMQEWGVDQIAISDTIGVATPGQVRSLVKNLSATGVPESRVALHMHDTYGQALANVYAGLEAGIRTFDASAAGIGGCPFAKSATGNLATDDLVWMLDGLGMQTGIDLEALTETSAWLSHVLRKPPTSRVAMALTSQTKKVAA